MSVTVDQIALNQWIVCAWMGQVAPGARRDTVVLGQRIRLTCLVDGALACHELAADGSAGRQLPLIQRYEMVFTTLGAEPRPLPEIAEFTESDRKIVNCGSVGVNTSPYRIIENFLDMAHLCFVHTDVLGSLDNTEVYSYKTEHRTGLDEVWATDCAFFQPAASKAAAVSGGGQLTHYKYRVMSPFSVMLYKNVYDEPDRDDVICVFIQPLGETQCFAYMTMAIVDANSTVGELIDFQQTIFLQDRVILENQRPALLPLATSAEIPTRADLSSIAFRRWLKATGIRFGILRAEAA